MSSLYCYYSFLLCVPFFLRGFDYFIPSLLGARFLLGGSSCSISKALYKKLYFFSLSKARLLKWSYGYIKAGVSLLLSSWTAIRFTSTRTSAKKICSECSSLKCNYRANVELSSKVYQCLDSFESSSWSSPALTIAYSWEMWAVFFIHLRYSIQICCLFIIN